MLYETLAGDRWLELRRSLDGYTYSHEVRCRGIIVSILPFRLRKKLLAPFSPKNLHAYEFLMRFERNPAHDLREVYEDIPFEMCSITGGLEASKSVRETALHELHEEAGVKIHTAKDPLVGKEPGAVTGYDLVPLGTCRPSKSADTTVALFTVDLGDVPREEAKGDGSQGEQGAYCDWRGSRDVIDSKDPLAHVSLLRFLNIIDHAPPAVRLRPRSKWASEQENV